MPKISGKHLPFLLSLVIHLIAILILTLILRKEQSTPALNIEKINLIPINIQTGINLQTKNEKGILKNKTQLFSSEVKKSIEQNSSSPISSQTNLRPIETMAPSVGTLSFKNTKAPSYPKFARENEIEGTVKLLIRFKQGQFENSTILISSGHKILDNAALEAVKSWSLKEEIDFELTRTFYFKLNDNSN